VEATFSGACRARFFSTISINCEKSTRPRGIVAGPGLGGFEIVLSRLKAVLSLYVLITYFFAFNKLQAAAPRDKALNLVTHFTLTAYSVKRPATLEDVTGHCGVSRGYEASQRRINDDVRELDYCGIPSPRPTGQLMQYAVCLLVWRHVLHYQSYRDRPINSLIASIWQGARADVSAA
jgi:hypothetical protein